MAIPTEVTVYVDVPANGRVDEGGGERAAGNSGGRIRVTAVATSRDEAQALIEELGQNVEQSIHEPEPVAYRAPVQAA
jgi:hypothetical protein